MKRFDKVTEVRRQSRARFGVVPTTRRKDDDRDTCRYCRQEPCACDELYDAWRDRQLEKEFDQ